MTTMVLSPAPVQQYFDSSGAPLAGGQLFSYAAGTTIPQAAFTDSTGGTALPNPVVLNSRGEVAPSGTGTSCGLWLDPTLAYKFVLAPSTDTNPPTSPIWTVDNIVSPQSAILAQLATYQAALVGVPVGGQIAYAGATAPPGWLLCYGQAVSRTTYAALFAVIGTAYGTGDGTTTFNLPDKRGRASIGADNMGGSAANNVTDAVSGINATTVGASGGSQYAQADTPSAASTTTVTITDPQHTHAPSLGGTILEYINTGGNSNIVSGTQVKGGALNSAPTGITATAATTTTVTSALTGASQNMIPVQVDNVIIYTGVGA